MGTRVHKNTQTYTYLSKAGLLISSRVSECAGGLGRLFIFPYMAIFVSCSFMVIHVLAKAWPSLSLFQLFH